MLLKSDICKNLLITPVATSKYVLVNAYHITFLDFFFLCSYSSLITGKWFNKFSSRCGEDVVPVALDIYFDGWKVSHEKKVNGLYFTIANMDKSKNWKVINKFPICLLPPEVDVQEVLPEILECVSWKLSPQMYQLSKFHNTEKYVKVEIARVIGDTPEIAEFTGCKNHRAGM